MRSRVRLFAHQGRQDLDDVLHRAHAAEDVGLDALAGGLVELDHDVDSVDAVDVEIGVEVGLGRDGRFVNLEHLVQHIDDPHGDFVLGHVRCQSGHDVLLLLMAGRGRQGARSVEAAQAVAWWLATRAASACTEAKCLRVSSELAESLMP